MCDNFPNIRITEGNAFALLLPLRTRTYVSSQPIDEDIDYTLLNNIVFTFGGVEYAAEATERGVQIILPETLAVGTYDVLLTAQYLGSEIRAAYESAVTIVSWSAQSTAEQYITGSPIVMRAAYVLSGAMTDAELEALKEEYREKNAQLDKAIAEAEVEKRKWEQKAADLNGVAHEATSQSILTAVENIDIDISYLAKEATLQGVSADAAAAKTAAEAVQTAVSALPTLPQMIDAGIIPINYDGSISIEGHPIDSVWNVIQNRSQITKLYDDKVTYLGAAAGGYYALPISSFGLNSLVEIELASLVSTTRCADWLSPRGGYANIRVAKFPRLVSFSVIYGRNFQSPILEELHIPMINKLDQTYSDMFLGATNLIYIYFGGNLTGNFLLPAWNPSNALMPDSTSLVKTGETFKSNLEKFLYGLRTNVADKLHDRTGLTAYSLTFHANVKAAILADQPTADAFTNKNWIIA